MMAVKPYKIRSDRPFTLPDTIAAMKALVHDAVAHDSRLDDLAKRLGEGRSVSGKIRSVYRWAIRRTVFRADPPGHELLRGPSVMLDEIERTGRMAGDCDETAVLVAAVLAAMGLEPWFTVVAKDEWRAFHHIFVTVTPILDRWYVDPQERWPCGVNPPPVGRMKHFRV